MKSKKQTAGIRKPKHSLFFYVAITRISFPIRPSSSSPSRPSFRYGKLDCQSIIDLGKLDSERTKGKNIFQNASKKIDLNIKHGAFSGLI